MNGAQTNGGQPLQCCWSHRFMEPFLDLQRIAPDIPLTLMDSSVHVAPCLSVCHSGENNEVVRSDLKKLPALPTQALKEHPSLAYCMNIFTYSWLARTSGTIVTRPAPFRPISAQASVKCPERAAGWGTSSLHHSPADA
ncbi:hypothetical protein P7K49_014850 [Saguinus oedipus]|uniref:Uncharacterized protein n=1 Tax=Saguinus oedipus TaxID=9490 RepID=A0ABQ9V859_SAGOE|nr:hypothetical protein P7K49_014850 [Saguinus oedipus]